MELILSEEEQEFLSKILEERQRELLEEIAHTDRRDFKEGLRRNEKLLESLVNRLREAAVQGARG
jgi:chromosome condensin MukBEF complex kleisin-like MukF subunit